RFSSMTYSGRRYAEVRACASSGAKNCVPDRGRRGLGKCLSASGAQAVAGMPIGRQKKGSPHPNPPPHGEEGSLPGGLDSRRGLTKVALEPTAVHGKDRAVHVIRSIRCEEDRRACEVRRTAPAPGGDAGEDVAIACLVRTERGRVVRLEIARCDRVHIDALR